METTIIKKINSVDLLKELGERLKNKEIEGLNLGSASLHVRKYPKLALSSESDNEVIFWLFLETGKTGIGKK